MLSGIIGLDRTPMSDADYALMCELVVDQLRGARIRMRNSEFSYPLSDKRVEAIYTDDIEPEPFDYERAEETLAAHRCRQRRHCLCRGRTAP